MVPSLSAPDVSVSGRVSSAPMGWLVDEAEVHTCYQRADNKEVCHEVCGRSRGLSNKIIFNSIHENLLKLWVTLCL